VSLSALSPSLQSLQVLCFLPFRTHFFGFPIPFYNKIASAQTGQNTTFSSGERTLINAFGQGLGLTFIVYALALKKLSANLNPAITLAVAIVMAVSHHKRRTIELKDERRFQQYRGEEHLLGKDRPKVEHLPAFLIVSFLKVVIQIGAAFIGTLYTMGMFPSNGMSSFSLFLALFLFILLNFSPK
jgi:glycerol uptake facilitator-like aquaporin